MTDTTKPPDGYADWLSFLLDCPRTFLQRIDSGFRLRDACAELAALRQRLAAATELLQRVEWLPDTNRAYPFCPFCGVNRRIPHNAHADNCKLAAFLKGQP